MEVIRGGHKDSERRKGKELVRVSVSSKAITRSQSRQGGESKRNERRFKELIVTIKMQQSLQVTTAANEDQASSESKERPGRELFLAHANLFVDDDDAGEYEKFDREEPNVPEHKNHQDNNIYGKLEFNKFKGFKAAIFQIGEDTAELKDAKRRMIDELRYAERCLLKNYLRTTPDIREIR
ncbi:hypothetical protein AgCh_029039 [Apium graveolens]